MKINQINNQKSITVCLTDIIVFTSSFDTFDIYSENCWLFLVIGTVLKYASQFRSIFKINHNGSNQINH